MRTLWRACRQLRRSPAFASAAIASLALGIGANSAIFTLTDALLFRSLPVKDPGALLHVASVDPTGRTVAMPSAFVEMLRTEHLFGGVCGFLTPLSTADIAGRIAPLSALALSGDCFDTLGLRPALGRFYTLNEDRAGAPPVVVLSYDEWQQDFGGRPDVLGKTIRIEGTPFTVVGVTERRFTGLLVGFPARLIFPIAHLVFPGVIPAFVPQDIIARTKPGQRIEQVMSRIDAEWPQLLNAATPPNVIGTARERFLARRPLVAPVSTGIDYSLRGRFERPLLALLAISGLVLLVSCVNVASLLLARGIERQRDTVVRAALGARRATLVKDALVESSLLLAAGGMLGALMAVAAARALVAIYGSANSTFDLNVAPDSHTVWFACAVSAAAFLAFAVGPAWKASRVDIAAFQAASSRVAGGRSHVRRIVVVAQVALTLVLVAVGSLFIGALSSLREAPLGFTAERILDTRLTPLPGAYGRSFRAGPYYRALLDAVANLPGVDAVAIAHNTPFVTLVQPEPVGVAGSDSNVLAEPQIVTDAFFRTMEIPLAAGEEFRRTDEDSGRRTVIVSQSLARVLFGVDNAIGKRIRVGSSPKNQALEIVGVARDAVLTRPQQRNVLVAYLNYWQAGQNLQVYSDLLVRVRDDPASLAPALRRELQRLGREYPGRVRSLSEQREAALAQERLLASLSTAFGALGLLLAAVGLYGLLSFSVASRTAEIGVRMALGAGRRQVINLVLREAATLLAVGGALGVPLAWIAGQTAARLLFGLDSPGLLPIGAAVLLLALVGATAASIPAHRAASIDPLNALKHD